MTKKLVPPEGGWGWVIMIAYALNNLIFIPIMQSFGLIFKDTFAMMGLSATDGTVIITTNAALGMMMGLVNGPLLNHFSYRKVSVVGAIFLFVGITATAFATKFEHFLITYGAITSVGVGIGLSSYPLALNSYFVKNRSKATGYAFTITGFGPILMPQLISFLLYMYDVQGVVLIVAAISAHSLVAAVLLQPVEWHMKVEEIEDEEKEDNGNDEKGEKRKAIDNEESIVALLENGNVRENQKLILREQRSIVDSTMSINHDAETQSIYGFDVTSSMRQNSMTETGQRRRSASIGQLEPTKNKWWSTSSVHSAHLGSSVKIFDEREHCKTIATIDEANEENQTKYGNNGRPLLSPVYNPELSVKTKERKGLTKFLSNVVNFFDLTLLKDPRYVNLMIGVSLAIFAELNFSLLTPFILDDIGLDTQQIATFLSVLSTADLIFRFVSPFIGDYFQMTARVMYMISLVMLIVTRFSLIMFDGFGALLGVALGLGVAKGIRTVYMTLVIPNYVPIHRLASASGLQMVVNGCLILAGGPLFGVIRDVTGSYAKGVYVMNMMTFCTISMWTVEIIYYKIKEGKKQETTIEKG